MKSMKSEITFEYDSTALYGVSLRGIVRDRHSKKQGSSSSIWYESANLNHREKKTVFVSTCIKPIRAEILKSPATALCPLLK